MKNNDFKVLYDLPYILKRNCRYCGNDFDIKHDSMKYCNAYCRTEFHNTIRRFPHLKLLADNDLPIKRQWITSTVDKILGHYPIADLKKLIDHQIDDQEKLWDLEIVINYDNFYIICDVCSINWLKLVMSFDARTIEWVEGKIDLDDYPLH